MEITGFEDTAKHPLSTALPENRPPNRNCGFFLETEPKPTDLGQRETVTTLLYIDLKYLAYRYENYTITATQNSVNQFITVVKYKCKLTLMHRHATTTDVCKVTKYSLHSLYFSRSDMKNIDFI